MVGAIDLNRPGSSGESPYQRIAIIECDYGAVVALRPRAFNFVA
jgi:hypothetical protein